MCRANSTVRGVLREIPDDRTVVVDLEASPEHLTRGTIRYIDHLLIVAEPYFKSLETARRYHALALDLGIPAVSVVGNKVRPEDSGLMSEYCSGRGFRLVGDVPFDSAFTEAERAGVAPVDHAPHSPGVRAIAALAEAVEEQV